MTRDSSRASSLIIIALVASTVVAGVLATQAIVAARQRQAISDAMLTQYATLAASEFSREVRRDVEQALSESLAHYAHPEHAGHKDPACGCLAVTDVEQWFESRPGGDVGNTEGAVRVSAHESDRSRIVATRREPHLTSANTHVGLVTTTRALSPVIRRAHQRATLLPSVLVGARDGRTLVDLSVHDANGDVVFRSVATSAGPHVVTTPVWPDQPLFTIQASMAPAFIAALGPEHSGGLTIPLVASLLTVNALLVVVGLRQLRRERELARLRSEFVAGVSHELRTPLAQIRMFSETLLLDRVRNKDEQRRSLEIIGQESTRLSQLVDNVLLFHRRPTNATDRERVEVDLKAFAAEVVESFQPLAASKRARLEYSWTADEVTIRADVSGMRQVMLNLLDNAVKYGPTGQTIGVAVTRRADRAVLTIDDAGPGVERTERDQIFRPFVRGRHINGSGGAGIGLSVVRQIVDAHGGEVAIEDAPRGGARFTVSLPLHASTRG